MVRGGARQVKWAPDGTASGAVLPADLGAGLPADPARRPAGRPRAQLPASSTKRHRAFTMRICSAE